MLTPLWALLVQSRVESAYSSSLAEKERLALGPLLAPLAEAGTLRQPGSARRRAIYRHSQRVHLMVIRTRSLAERRIRR